MEKPYYVRNHNIFTSGNMLSYPAGGSTNIYMEDKDGNASYNFETIDKIYDNYVENNFIPIIELDFMPLDLVPNSKDLLSDWKMGRDVGQELYEQNKWKLPPKDYKKWQELIETLANHLYERYGEQVQNWYFEVWNEPNLTNYWLGSVEDYCKLYDYSVEAIKRVNKSFKIGGPATSDVGMEFLRQFLEHVTSGKNYVTNETGTLIDFISFHTKGAYYVPRRSYGHKVSCQSPSLPKILNDIRNNLIVCNEFEQLNHLPIFIDECDPAVGTIYGVYDNPNYIICNTEYYPCIVASIIYHILSLSNRIQLITHWSFYMEGKRLFEGNRTLMTNYNLHLPILSGLKLFGKLKYKRLFIEMNSIQLPIFAIATCDDENRSFQLLLFYHVDDWTHEHTQSINITFINIPLQNVLLKHYRIDSNHSNTYAEWVKIGKPDELDANQLEHLKHSQELKLLYEPVEYKIENNRLKLAPFDLPSHSISFIELINNSI
ncbi:unnamed protein product [Rotaria sp. Silwood1]|nr:unnamed protein product [Rotaria sp. Silwood1]CAF3740503.1 unnamed protein product [Rotaria sp. Silwood1]CAF3882919.1 unnamed protein product [Rotaria sp. Silwood1]CAF4695878.1 unnamed protein product [Rotaria sp. Silwood1]CAF4714195.1 unnamed protein product [Rotaria sp. Silwood1]